MKQEPCLSYINHNWGFEIINFEQTKKIIQYLPICVVDPKGIYEYPDPYKGLSFIDLRSEYMSWTTRISLFLVNLHWVILNEMFSEMSHMIAKENQTIKQLIKNYGELSSECKTECEQINKVFG